MRQRIGTATVALLIVFLVAPGARGVEPTVPAELQAPIIANLWQFDRNFPRRGPITLGVLYQEKYRTSFVAAHELCDAFLRTRLPVRCVLIDISVPVQLADLLAGHDIDAVYFTPLRAVDVAVLLLPLRTKRIRSVTSVDEYVTSGVALGLALRGDHAQIVVNLPAARMEGSDFSSQLLKLARVIQ